MAPFTVEHRGGRGSKPGDKVRQGRVERPPAPPVAAGKLRIVFDARADGCVYALLSRAEIGVVCPQPQGGRPGWNWLCFLPEQHSKPKFAETIDKAKGALRSAVETWLEAAGLAVKPARPRGQVTAWRAGEG